jgi:DNA polymerase-3 subunit epsilon
VSSVQQTAFPPVAPRSWLANLPLAFIDLETTGLDASKCGTVSFSIVRTTNNPEEIVDRCDLFILPHAAAVLEPGALRINGYDPAKWAERGAISEADAIMRITPLVAGCLWVGHNPSFDKNFTDAMYRRCGAIFPKLGWSFLVDTVSLSWPLVIDGGLDNGKLGTIASHLGIVNEAAHTAAADVEVTRQIYAEMFRRFRAGAVAKAA